MKRKIIRITALGASLLAGAAFGLSACGAPEADYTAEGSYLTVNKPCKAIYEAEFVNTEAYEISDDNPAVIVERQSASGGKFLAAADGNVDGSGGGYFSFNVYLAFNAEIKMTVSYAQTENNKDNEIDMRDSYNYLIDENKSVILSEENCILAARDSVDNWDKIKYDTFTLPKGVHAFRASVAKNTGKGNPDIDCFEFDVTEISEIEYDGITVPSNDFHTPLQYAYIHDDYSKISDYAKGVIELTRPNAIILDYSDIKYSSSYAVEYADNEGFENSVTVKDIKTKQYGVYNLKLGQKLYWRAAANESGLKNAKVRMMTVASEGPRNMFIDGLTNVRDIGGYDSSLVEGGKIRQGLYYRGAALVDVELGTGKIKKQLITEAGKAEMLRLGIKEEIDLRDKEQCTGPYVEGINYNAISIPSRTESTRFEKFEEEYKQIFTLIANADEAPVYLHCTAGADRTGISTFMLLTVCGVSYEDAARDYLFTNFSTHGERKISSEFEKWNTKLDKLEGETKADKAKSWLISKGLTSEQVERIREIFVEGYTAA